MEVVVALYKKSKNREKAEKIHKINRSNPTKSWISAKKVSASWCVTAKSRFYNQSKQLDGYSNRVCWAQTPSPLTERIQEQSRAPDLWMWADLVASGASTTSSGEPAAGGCLLGCSSLLVGRRSWHTGRSGLRSWHLSRDMMRWGLWPRPRTRSAFQLTCVGLHPCEDHPHHDPEAVDVGLLRGGRVDALQVLGGHVAQGAGPSRPDWLPFMAPPARLLLCEFAPALRYG